MPEMFANLNSGDADNAGQETVDITVVGGDFTGGGTAVTWTTLTGKPTTFNATLAGSGSAATASHSDHTHTVSQVTDLTAAKLMASTAPTVVHTAATDVAGLVTSLNALIDALKTRGVTA